MSILFDPVHVGRHDLIVTEAARPSADGQGYLTKPGIYTDAHVAD